MTTIEDILAQCLTDLEQGSSVEDCLARYPKHRDELEPLLRVAQQVRSAPDVGPSPAFRQTARARIVRRIRDRESTGQHQRVPGHAGLLARLMSSIRIPTPVRRFAVPAMAAITVILLLGTLGVGAVYASAGSLPGDSLYPVKLAGERVRLALAFSDSGEAKLHLRLASERLEEAAAVVERNGADEIEPLMGRYAAHVEAASSVLEHQHARGEDVASLAARFQERLARHEEVLSRVQEKVPGEARFAVEQALTASRRAQDRIPKRPEVPPTAGPTSTPTVTSTFTASPTGTETARPGPTNTPTVTSEPAQKSGPSETPVPPGQTRTPQPPGQTRTPEPPGQTRTPQPPGQTCTPEPPGQTKTPQPPGQTRTPEPPGQTKTSEPPGQTRTPEPPGRTMTPQPPGQTRTPQAPGLTRTPGRGD